MCIRICGMCSQDSLCDTNPNIIFQNTLSEFNQQISMLPISICKYQILTYDPVTTLVLLGFFFLVFSSTLGQHEFSDAPAQKHNLFFQMTFFFSLEESISCCFTICELLHIIVNLLLKNTTKERSLKGLEKKN